MGPLTFNCTEKSQLLGVANDLILRVPLYAQDKSLFGMINGFDGLVPWIPGRDTKFGGELAYGLMVA